MRKLLVAFAIVAAFSVKVKADETILADFGSLSIHLPFSSISAVGLWDGISKRSLAGAETPLVTWKRLQLVGGAVTTIDSDSVGTPFLGVHVIVPNPAENYVALSSFHPGIFAGRNFRANEWLLGIKASVGLF